MKRIYLTQDYLDKIQRLKGAIKKDTTFIKLLIDEAEEKQKVYEEYRSLNCKWLIKDELKRLSTLKAKYEIPKEDEIELI